MILSRKPQILTILFLIILCWLTSCYTSGTILISYSADYDPIENVTNYDKYPFGKVKMPGKWLLAKYDEVNRTHFYRNIDNVFLGITMAYCKQYTFYKNDMTENSFVRAFYEWDSKYLADEVNGTRAIVNIDSINHTILWNLTNDKEIDTYYLIGAKNGRAYVFLIATEEWSDEDEISFIKKLYINTYIYN